MKNAKASPNLQLIEDIAEVVGAGVIGQPLGSADGAQGQAAAVLDFMADFERVALAHCPDNVFALGIAYAMGCDKDLRIGAGLRARGLVVVAQKELTTDRRPGSPEFAAGSP